MELHDGLEFNKEKIYYVYLPSTSYACRWVKTLRIGDVIFVCFRIEDEGWGFHKNFYVQTRYVTQIIEFDSMAEYKEHYKSWDEEQRERKFKSDV